MMIALSLYTFVKFLHVLLAIVAVGFNASYGIWLARAARDPAHAPFTLRGVKMLDDRIANPAYGLLLMTGIAMVLIGDLDLTTFWLATALVLYVIAVVLGLFVYTPTLRRQIAAIDAEGPSSSSYQRLSQRGTAVGAILAIDVIAIVFLMVTKPTFE
jgi:uncharacterized membrane protein